MSKQRAEQLKEVFYKLLPSGEIFTPQNDTLNTDLKAGILSRMFEGVLDNLNKIPQAVNPINCTDDFLFPDWESDLSLPYCLPKNKLSFHQRQEIVVNKIENNTNLSKLSFIHLLKLYGYAVNDLVQRSPFNYRLVVNLENKRTSFFNMLSNVGAPLKSYTASNLGELQCLIAKYVRSGVKVTVDLLV